MKNILAIIPARGGSKGIPGKNIITIDGLPLIAHTIQHSVGSNCITRTVVSTDNTEISKISKQYGAEVIMRPGLISGDTSGSELALLHVLDDLKKRESYEPEVVVFLQCTSPVRLPSDIDNAMDVFNTKSADSLFSGTKVNGFVWNIKDDPKPTSYNYKHRPRRQDAPIEVVENGSIYIFKTGLLIKTKNRLGGKIVVYEMPALRSFQIDEPDDVKTVELIMGLINNDG